MARLVDLTSVSGAYGTRLLAEAGHDVVRIEPPAGDALRRLGPFVGDVPGRERGAFHQFVNAGKRSLSLNLDTADGRAVLLALVERSDAVVGSLPLPVAERSLRAHQPRLVLTLVEEAPPELCAIARSGLLSLVGFPEGLPIALGGHIVYALSGLYVGLATAMGLLQQQVAGRGARTTVSVQQSLETQMEQAMLEYTLSGRGTERGGSRGRITATSGAYPCQDGYCIVSVGGGGPGGWSRFVEWVGDPELADPALAAEEKRQEQRATIQDRIHAWSQRFPRDELIAEAQRRHLPASPVTTPLDLTDDPQLIARGFLTPMDHPLLGRLLFPRGAIATVLDRPLGPAPTLGQHNAEFLGELGYSPADHASLVESGVM
jgi:crotonobetainyl-CoA:carnitine CoA-transferase CaiB-like acyl-CoA transferase